MPNYNYRTCYVCVNRVQHIVHLRTMLYFPLSAFIRQLVENAIADLLCGLAFIPRL